MSQSPDEFVCTGSGPSITQLIRAAWGHDLQPACKFIRRKFMRLALLSQSLDTGMAQMWQPKLVVGLTKAMAVELGSQGVTVNAFASEFRILHCCKLSRVLSCRVTGSNSDCNDISCPEKSKGSASASEPCGYGEAEEVAHITASVCLPVFVFKRLCHQRRRWAAGE